MDVYTFERIVDQRKRKGRKQYLVAWGNGEETWEPASNFIDKSILPRIGRKQRKLQLHDGQPSYDNQPGLTPDTRPGNASDSQPGLTPDTRAGNASDSQPGLTPDTRPGNASDSQPGMTPDTQPGNASDSQPGLTLDTRPGNASDSRPGMTPDTRPGNASDSQLWMTPDIRPGNASDSQPGMTPDTQPGNASDSQLWMTPDIRPGNASDSQPGMTPDTRPGKASDSQPRMTLDTPLLMTEIPVLMSSDTPPKITYDSWTHDLTDHPHPDPSSSVATCSSNVPADTWTSLYESSNVMVVVKASATKDDILAAVKGALPTEDLTKKKSGHTRSHLVCHLCGFVFKNCRYSQHFRRHHKIGDAVRLKFMKEEMKNFSEKLSTREVKMPEKLTCNICGARLLHLQLHLKRNHHVADRRVRKEMKEASFANQLETELLENIGSPSGGAASIDSPESNDDTLHRFCDSKKGWRHKPTTALRQEKQLRSIFKQVSEQLTPSQILREKLDDVEKVLLGKLPQQTASVKSIVIALLEFTRFVSTREVEYSQEWDAVRRRLETWKRDACSMDLKREAALQDKLGDDGYLPSKEQLCELRDKVDEEISVLSNKSDVRRNDAVRMRRLLTSAILLRNFQRAGTIINATLKEYEEVKDSVMRVHDHKSQSTYGSAHLVLDGLLDSLRLYVRNFRHLLASKEEHQHLLFPASAPADDIGELCRGYKMSINITPTILRKAASTAAYDELSEQERLKLATHMSHRSETQFKAYAAKTRRSESTKTVKKMEEVIYGQKAAQVAEWLNSTGEGYRDPDSSTIPSSAGEMKRINFGTDELFVIEKEARRLKASGVFVSQALALALMARCRPLLSDRSPKSVENKLRERLCALQNGWREPRGESSGRSRL